MRGALLAIALLACSAFGVAQAQVIKLTGVQVVNPDGSVTPTLSWCTEQTASAGLTTCTNPGPASACTATGGWDGTRAASGTQGQTPVRTSTTYTLSCVWPGADKFTVNWVPPTANDDGSPLTDLAGFRVYYGTSASMSSNQIKDVAQPGASSVVIGPGLAPATYYVVVSAYNSKGVESVKVPAPPASRTLGAGATVGQAFKVTVPNAPTNVQVQ